MSELWGNERMFIGGDMEEDPRHRTIEGFIEGLRILARKKEEYIKERYKKIRNSL